MIQHLKPRICTCLLALILSACIPGAGVTRNNRPFIPTGGEPLSIVAHTPTSTVTPTVTPPAPTPTAAPIAITATVWTSIPQTPILMYHRFDPNPDAVPNNFTTTLSDFEQHLITLYKAGFTLVALDDWLRGEIHVPEGRRPLILTLDDLFYADQISLDENGQPAPHSGIGILWEFYRENPAFGFHAALFYNLGDKAYNNIYTNNEFSVGDGWRADRARAIAWGIRNGALPYNHFYEHPFLNELEPDQILWQLEENDRALREALALVNAENLTADLPNILALPYVIWPDTEAGRDVLFQYLSPEGKPVSAIVEGDYAANAKLFPAPFSHTFDRWHVPRVIGNQEAIEIILEKIIDISPAGRCDLGNLPKEALSVQTSLLSNRILTLISAGNCPWGYYIVEDNVFYADENGIIQLLP